MKLTKSCVLVHFPWNSLRLVDQGLLSDLPKGIDHLLCVHVVDETQFGSGAKTHRHGFDRSCSRRLHFYRAGLRDLSAGVADLGSQLLLLRGKPATVLVDLVKRLGTLGMEVRQLRTSWQFCTEERDVIDDLKRGLPNVPLHLAKDHTLVRSERFLADLPDVYTAFRKGAEAVLAREGEAAAWREYHGPPPKALPPFPPALIDSLGDAFDRVNIHSDDVSDFFFGKA